MSIGSVEELSFSLLDVGMQVLLPECFVGKSCEPRRSCAPCALVRPQIRLWPRGMVSNIIDMQPPSQNQT